MSDEASSWKSLAKYPKPDNKINKIKSPNFGLSLELGVLRQQGIGDVTQSFYNAIATRYYF